MERAKEAISGILHKDGHHNTTIHKSTEAPVTKEEVHNPHTSHTTTAVDREIHEEHHQTVIQPVKDREVLPGQHHHRVLPGETREQHHGKDRDVEHKLQEQQTQFRDTTNVLPAEHHTGRTAVAEGEHHHHHVHQHVQPVIEKETIQPHVVHNVVPVHEVVHNEPVVHKPAVNPAMTMEEFQKTGGNLGSGKEHYQYTGDPMNVDNKAHVTRGGQSFDGAGVPRTTGAGTGTGTGLTGQHDHHHHHQGGVGGVGAGDNDHKLRETMRDNDTSSDRVRNDERGGVKGLIDKVTGRS